MLIKRNCFLLLLSFLPLIIYSQHINNEFSVGFRVNVTRIDPTFEQNRSSVENLLDYLNSIQNDSTIKVVEVTFCGAASPEGSDRWNRMLAHRRLTSLEKIVRTELTLPDSVIFRNDTHIPWAYLKEKVSKTNLPNKNAILDVLSSDSTLVPHINGKEVDMRIVNLKKMNDGKVWSDLFRRYFKDMRNAYVVFTIYKKEQLPVIELVRPSLIPEYVDWNAVCDIKQYPLPLPMSPYQEWTPHWYLKTNLIGLGMLMANLAVETDVAKHWSVSLPIYYSAWNYFKSTIKFRTFSVQPELRYWFSPLNDGWYTGVHLGLSYYNYAFDGDIRYQDHKGKTPALGGGVSLGYRLPISKDNRWKMELSVGAGVYSLKYDKFNNTPNVKDGLLKETIKKTYWGIDQASISIAYTFDWNKKGGLK